MATMQIQNLTRNPYKIPTAGKEIITSDRVIPVGMSGEIDADKHALLMKANPAYKAMIEQNKLRVSALKLDEVSEEDLTNTSDPEKPADLDEELTAEGAEGTIDVSVESKGVEVVQAAPADKKQSAPKKKK